VRSQVDGKLISVNFREGKDVKRGDVLARIDPTTYQAQLDQATAKKALDEAQLANARLDLERYTNLLKTNAVNRQQVDTTRALVAQLEAQVRLDQGAIDNARALLDYCTITAPIDGRVGIRLVDQGNIVHASDPTGIVVLTQIRPIAVLFILPSSSSGRSTRRSPSGLCRPRPPSPTGEGCSTAAGCRWSTTRSIRRPERCSSRPSFPMRICSSGRANSSTCGC